MINGALEKRFGENIMKFQNQEKLIEFVKELASSDKETLGLISAAISLNERFPKTKLLTNKQLIEASNLLVVKSENVLSMKDAINIVCSLYKIY